MKTKILKNLTLMAAACIGLLALTGCQPGVKSSGSISSSIEQKNFTVDGISFAMNKIAGVTVSNTNNLGHEDERDNKPHKASISTYMIGETEVTQELWEAVMGANESFFFDNPAAGERQEKRPVENVSWYDCIAFCNKLSLKLGLECCYSVSGIEDWETLTYDDIPSEDDAKWNNTSVDLSKNGFRLPTAAEWEWAAKGGTEDKWAGTNSKSNLGEYAWFFDNADNKTHEVRKKKPNGYGLYDMSGNVWEWCFDTYKNYTGMQSEAKRVGFGGSWNYYAVYCVCAFRFHNHPDFMDSRLGLRVVCRP